MRCAIYARYSSDLQRDSSVEDQIRKCREFAEKQGWIVLENYVRFDQAVSGAALAGRKALLSLIEAAKQKPRPFDRLLVEDTSRMARNLADGLRLTEVLRYHSVFVTAVSQGIDSQQKTSRQLLTLHGMMDEQFLVGLAEKVHRGQEGRVLKGLHPGGRCYGYTNVPIEDSSRHAKYGRPAVIGVQLEINPPEAAVVQRIFQMYADGRGLAQIAKTLNAEGVLSPQSPRGRLLRSWCPSSIREMLRNERYRGVHIWNRTEKQRNPDTGRKTSRQRPESEWLRVEVPEWRIVPQELWNAVQSRIAVIREQVGVPRYAGMNRTTKGGQYLFSGLLICGRCGSRIVIISGRGRRGYVKYGCPNHRYRGVCANKLTIRQDRLEAQLLAALEKRVLMPEMIEYALRRFEETLHRRLAEVRNPHTTVSALEKERVKLQAQARRLAEAIADAGHSPSLLAHLASTEEKLTRVQQQIDSCKAEKFAVNAEEIRKFVIENVTRLRSLLRHDFTKARTALMSHVKPLVLTPQESPDGPLYAVSGNIDLPVSTGSVMQMVARDGIEPPTPAFSGLESPILISLI